MPEQNYMIRCYALGHEWQPILAEIHCNVIVVSSNVQWQYCTDIDAANEWGALSSVSANMREAIPSVAPSIPSIAPGVEIFRFPRGEIIAHVRAYPSDSGQIWVHYVH